MELRGVISNGRIVIDGPLPLPEGTPVSVRLRRAPSASTRSQTTRKPARRPAARPGQSPLLALASLGVATGLPDLADRHDHIVDGRLAAPSATRRPRRKARS